MPKLKDEIRAAENFAERTFLRVLGGTVGSQQFEKGDIFIAEHYGTNVAALVKAGTVEIVSEAEALIAADLATTADDPAAPVVALDKAPTPAEQVIAIREAAVQDATATTAEDPATTADDPAAPTQTGPS